MIRNRYCWPCAWTTGLDNPARCPAMKSGTVPELVALGWWMRRSSPGTTTATFCPKHAALAREAERSRRAAWLRAHGFVVRGSLAGKRGS